MYYGITSESQIIDIASIQTAVESIKNAATDFSTCATGVSTAAGICDASALAIEGKTLQPTIEELAEGIQGLQSQVEELADSILAVANQVYNSQCIELREYQAEQERLRKEAEARNNE